MCVVTQNSPGIIWLCILKSCPDHVLHTLRPRTIKLSQLVYVYPDQNISQCASFWNFMAIHSQYCLDHLFHTVTTSLGARCVDPESGHGDLQVATDLFVTSNMQTYIHFIHVVPHTRICT